MDPGLTWSVLHPGSPLPGSPYFPATRRCGPHWILIRAPVLDGYPRYHSISFHPRQGLSCSPLTPATEILPISFLLFLQYNISCLELSGEAIPWSKDFISSYKIHHLWISGVKAQRAQRIEFSTVGGLRRHSLGGELSPNCFRFTLPYRHDRHHWQRCADACSTDCQLHQNLVRYSSSQQSGCERH